MPSSHIEAAVTGWWNTLTSDEQAEVDETGRQRLVLHLTWTDKLVAGTSEETRMGMLTAMIDGYPHPDRLLSWLGHPAQPATQAR